MSSPAICVDDDGHYRIYFVNANKKVCTTFTIGNVTVEGIYYNSGNVNDEKKVKLRVAHSDTERFVTLSMLFEERIPQVDVLSKFAVFEAYAFGAKGRLAQIGENTGVMKAILRSKGYGIETISPTSVKLSAFGHGKADKIQMADAWFDRFGFHVHDQLCCDKGGSPASDVIDAFFVMDAWNKNLDKKNIENFSTETTIKKEQK
jgi:Holliday junction resolvasome RuvABC endonuclease subunit